MGDNCSCPNQLGTPVVGGGGGGGSGTQTLSQAGNIVSLSPGGGSVDISVTTSVASSAQKTTAQSYSEGLLATSFDSDLFVKRTEVGTPLEPQPLTVNGTLDVIIDPTGFVRLTNLGSVLPAGQNVVYIDPILGTLAQGGAPASEWVGTATSDLNMNGYNITTPANLTIATDTGTLTIYNPVIGVGGAQLNVNGSASIRGNTAQLQVLDGDGVQQGVLSYNVADGQTHLDGNDLAISGGESVNITAGNSDITLLASVGSINIESHSDIGISCNNGGTITVGGSNTPVVDVYGVANVRLRSNGGAVYVGGGATVTETVNVEANTDVNVTASTGSVSITGAGVGITANDASVSIASVVSGNVSISAYEALSISTDNNGISITSADTLSIGATTTCSIGGQGTTIGGGDEYLTMSAETVTVTSASNIDMTTGQFVNITATANDINLTANAGSIVANAGVISVGGAGTNQVNISTADMGSIVGIAGETVNINGGFLNATLGGSISLITSGTVGIVADDPITISTTGNTDTINITSGGDLILNTGGELLLTGGNIQSTAYGTPSGQYLRINLNGTYYKIQLLDDV